MTTKKVKAANKAAKTKLSEIPKKAPTPRAALAEVARINPEEAIRALELEQIKKDLPKIKAGYTVAVHQLVVEKGGKTRTQIFEGMVLRALRQKKLAASITVRKVASGVGVERTFFLNSPLIQKVEVKKKARVRRAKLYYLRKLSGKAAAQKEVVEKTGPAGKSG